VSLVVFRNVEKGFVKSGSSNYYQAIDGLNLQIEEGEFFCLLGPTGCGKTTVLTMLAGFEQPNAGSIELGGRLVTGPGRDRAVVFQGDDSLYGWLTARENVEFGPRARGVRATERRAIAERYLELVGLKGQGDKYPHELSGGMKQRIQIARVLANDPAMLLMDEPFGALDAQTRRVMQYQLARIWKASRKAVLFITHDIDEAIILGNRIGVMRAGPASSIKGIVEVKLDGARDRSDPRFGDYYLEISKLIEEEVNKSLNTGERG